MPSKLRRYELLRPIKFNDGKDVPREWLAEAAKEVSNFFGAVSYETAEIQGQWRQAGITFHDTLVKIVADIEVNKGNPTVATLNRLFGPIGFKVGLVRKNR